MGGPISNCTYLVIMFMSLIYLLHLLSYYQCLTLPYLSMMLGMLYLLWTPSILTVALNIRLILFYVIDGLAGGIPILST